MTKLWILLFSICFSLKSFSQPILEGSWSSGGGEIIADQYNPWFVNLPNQSSTVKYCIVVGDHFPHTSEQYKSAIEFALRWWWDELSNGFTPSYQFWDADEVLVKYNLGYIRQWIYQEQCSAETDLRFQFGKVDEVQQQQLQSMKINLRKFVAITIRTSYSPELRAKGFIYISPDQGPMQFQVQNPLPNLWHDAENGLQKLSQMLIHELGHVFGFPHTDNQLSVMNHQFAENLVTTEDFEGTLKNQSTLFPKLSQLEKDFCPFDYDGKYNQLKNYLELMDTNICIRVIADLNRIIFLQKTKNAVRWQELARANLITLQKSYESSVSMWLSSSQNIFSVVPNNGRIPGIQSVSLKMKGKLQFRNENKFKNILILATPKQIQVIGANEKGDLFEDLLPN